MTDIDHCPKCGEYLHDEMGHMCPSPLQQCLETIRAALDCESHFHKPTIINNDKDFAIGDNAIVICDRCVERMKKCLGLGKDDPVPTSFRMWGK
jgi:hypothetical protein